MASKQTQPLKADGVCSAAQVQGDETSSCSIAHQDVTRLGLKMYLRLRHNAGITGQILLSLLNCDFAKPVFLNTTYEKLSKRVVYVHLQPLFLCFLQVVFIFIQFYGTSKIVPNKVFVQSQVSLISSLPHPINTSVEAPLAASTSRQVRCQISLVHIEYRYNNHIPRI